MRPTHLTLPSILMTAVMNSSLAATATPPPPDVLMSDEGLRESQDHLLKMHALSDRILAAKNPTERQNLKDQQLQLMKDFELTHYRRMQKHIQALEKSTAPK